MAVTVKIEDKSKKTTKGAVVEAAPAALTDYAAPGEHTESLKMFLIWVLCMLVLCVGLSSNIITQPFGIGITIWWFVSVFIYFFLAPRILLRRLRMHGPEYELTTQKNPRLKALVTKGSAMLGVSPPETFLVDEGTSQIRILGRKDPYFMIVTQTAVDALEPPELDCLALRALAHARMGHVRRLMMLQFLNDTPPTARMLVWPVGFYATLLMINWRWLADQTADRVVLLLIKNHKLLTSAILKQYAVSDPEMQQYKVTTQDVDNYIKQAGFIGMEGTEISTQYKLGAAIQGNPFLEDRIRALSEWSRSPEYQEAINKLAEARSGKSATGRAPAAPSASGSHPAPVKK
ncbi:MAG: hypothetical protein M3347_05720 [Armatimonadota bacterium]|nr:hypothetical protein [Armatimonadota bacterium]